MAHMRRCPQHGPNSELSHEAARLRKDVLDGEKHLHNIQNLIKEAERNPSKILQLTKQVEKLSSQLKRKTKINEDFQDRLKVYEEEANDRERMLDLPQRSNYGESNELGERAFNLVIELKAHVQILKRALSERDDALKTLDTDLSFECYKVKQLKEKQDEAQKKIREFTLVQNISHKKIRSVVGEFVMLQKEFVNVRKITEDLKVFSNDIATIPVVFRETCRKYSMLNTDGSGNTIEKSQRNTHFDPNILCNGSRVSQTPCAEHRVGTFSKYYPSRIIKTGNYDTFDHNSSQLNVHNPENNHSYAEGFKLKKRPKLTGECLHRDVVENLNEAYLTKISPQEAENSLPELAQNATSTLYEKEQKQTTIHSNIVECAACKYNTNTESASLKNKLALRNLESTVTNQEKEIQRLLQNQTETEKQLSEFRTKYAEKLKLVSKLQNENATHVEKIVNLETSIDNQLGAQNQQTEENSQLQKDLRTTKQR